MGDCLSHSYDDMPVPAVAFREAGYDESLLTPEVFEYIETLPKHIFYHESPYYWVNKFIDGTWDNLVADGAVVSGHDLKPVLKILTDLGISPSSGLAEKLTDENKLALHYRPSLAYWAKWFLKRTFYGTDDDDAHPPTATTVVLPESEFFVDGAAPNKTLRSDSRDHIFFLYHGTVKPSALSIVDNGLDIDKSQCDAHGFYVTRSFEVAKTYANMKARLSSIATIDAAVVAFETSAELMGRFTQSTWHGRASSLPSKMLMRRKQILIPDYFTMDDDKSLFICSVQMAETFYRSMRVVTL